MILRCRPVFSGLRNRSMPSFLLPLRFCPAAARPRNHPVESGGAHQRPTGSRSEITPFSFWSVLSAGANQCRGRSVGRSGLSFGTEIDGSGQIEKWLHLLRSASRR